MSLDLLLRLQRAHAFDPTPMRDDLGAYHVPFGTLVDNTHPERTLLDAALRAERVALIGDSGAGKSSLTARVLGSLAEGVAPIVVPVARESYDVVREPRAMFAHLVSVISTHAHQASLVDDRGRDDALAHVAPQRPVGRSAGRPVGCCPTSPSSGVWSARPSRFGTRPDCRRGGSHAVSASTSAPSVRSGRRDRSTPSSATWCRRARR